MENTKDCAELEEILERLSGLLDNLYEYVEEEDERIYINSVEDELRAYLYQKGLLNNKDCYPTPIDVNDLSTNKN